MFKIRNSQKQPDFYAPFLQENGGFQVPPTTQLYDCRPSIVEIKKATGRTTIRGNLTYLPSRPAIYGKYRKENSGNLTEKAVPVVRNSFLPSRKAVNLPDNNIYRTTEEERDALRLEDIERNGNLVQVSNKTLDRVYDKFNLFTISDELIDLEKKGKLEKKDVRASAILKLVKEVKSALRTNSLEEVREALNKVKKHKANIIPDLSDLGSEPDDVAQHPALLLALMNELVDEEDTDEYMLLLLAEMIGNGDIYVNPENAMINDLINIKVLAKLSIEDIEDGIDSIRDVDTRILLASILNKAKEKEEGYIESDTEEKYAEADEETYAESPPIPSLGIPKVPPELPKDILEKEFEPPSLPPDLPKDILEEEFEPEQIYEVVEYGSNEKIQKQIQDYINKTRNEIVRMLAKLPRQLDPSFEDKINMNKKRMLNIGKELFTIKNFESDDIKDYTQKLINELNEEKNKLTGLVNSIEAPKQQEMLDDEPLIEEIKEEVKEENNPFADEETLKNVLEKENRVNKLKDLARAFNKYVASLPKFKINTQNISNITKASKQNIKKLMLDKYRQFTASQSQPRRRMLAFDKDLEDKLRQCALQNTRNVPQKVIINNYKIPQLNDRNIVGVVEDICKKAGFADEAKQRTFNCASRALITRLLDDGIINKTKAKELRDRLKIIQEKGTSKDKVKNYKRVFGELASEGDIRKGGPSVRPQPRAEPQPGEPSRPMTLADLPQAKTIEQIQRMR